ncbi:kinase interacting (KIP1-like) family protein [Actinidia rufa]|uniref:Kinase interacting (KIP1-like) family protein n=1 Tax=Actinidia rufa TaxID=165716 RepID=A0A7J0DH20_9ERIC|nr:kinase interacting (KIP1-like) family protein [Actinidia rufa]
MLRIIEEDADSFAKRAEMYYKKRTELISMIEDFYRAHRLLAERYDQVKSDTRFRHITPWGSPLSFPYRQEKSMMTSIDIINPTIATPTPMTPWNLGEIERLKEENKIQKEQLDEKDEEKREVIRQLSLAMDALRVENVKLRKCVAKESPKKSSPSEFNRLKGMFIRKLFNGSPKSQASVVAL